MSLRNHKFAESPSCAYRTVKALAIAAITAALLSSNSVVASEVDVPWWVSFKGDHWFWQNGFDLSEPMDDGVAGSDFYFRKTAPRNVDAAPDRTVYYQLANQPPYTVSMGPVIFQYHGARVRMVEGVHQTPERVRVAFNFLTAFSGWGSGGELHGAYLGEVVGGPPVHASGWLKGFLTREAIMSWVASSNDLCGKREARYIYRYRYHAPDGSIMALYEAPGEVARTSTWSGSSCPKTVVPAPEPNLFWSREGNAALDVTNKCKPVMRWSDGSTEEFHGAITVDTPEAPVADIAAWGFEPACTAEQLSGDLRITDRNGNITKYSFSDTTETMTDPRGLQTVLTYDRGTGGFRRLQTVDLPAIGNAPAYRYTIQWRATPLEIRFDQIWSEVVCRSTVDGRPTPCSRASRVELVESIVTPDGRSYRFDYGPWGNLRRIVEPAGAIREFVFGDHDNLAYANAALPLYNRVEQCGTLCRPWSGEAVKMQARGVIEERLLPDGESGIVHKNSYKFVLRKLDLPSCTFDSIGAALSGPPGCSQVWRELTRPDGTTITKTGWVTRAFLPVNSGDSRYSIPPDYPVDIHGFELGEETWSGTKLIGATYHGDKDTGALWYDYDVVKLLISSTAVPASVRPVKTKTLRDGLMLTTNYRYGNTLDIDPGTSSEARSTEGVTSVCVYAGSVDANGCDVASATPLSRTDTTYVHYFSGTGLTRNLLNLTGSTRLYGPNADKTAFATTPVSETTYRYDEFAVSASGLPASVLDSTLSRNARTERGNVTTTTQRVDAQKTISAETRYFDTGEVQSVKDPRGGTTTYDLGFALCSASKRRINSVTNPKGHVTKSVVDCATGATLSTTDPNGDSTYIQYDAFGRAVESAEPGDFLTALPTTGPAAFTRDPLAPTSAGTKPGDAPVSSWKEYLSLGVTGQQRVVNHIRDGSASGRYSKSFEDGLGRVVQTREKVDKSKTGFDEVVSTTVYDNMGRVVKTYFPCYAAVSDIVTPHCRTAASTTSYDALGRETGTTGPGGAATSHSYGQENGQWVTTTVDARGFTSKTYTDLLERVVRSDRESSRCGGFCTTRFEHDGAGRLLKQLDHRGNTIVFTYDDLGRQLTMSDPNMGNWSYQHDESGNIIKQTDAKGQEIRFAYDALNRITLKDLPPTIKTGELPGPEDVTYFYDGEGPIPPGDVGPTPIISGLTPAVVNAGGGDFVLIVGGTNFVAGSVVQFNGQNRQTTFTSVQELRATILASDIQASGTFNVIVVNPGGAASAVASFAVTSPIPTVSSISPAGAAVGSPEIVLTVSGSNFVTGSIITFNGQERQTTFVSALTLKATILASDLQTPGSYLVKVMNPAPGGGMSAGTSFTVSAPATVTMTAPASGTLFRRPANITLTATVSSSVGVSKVEFLRDGFLIGQVATAPWSMVWTNAPEGTFQIAARATDSNGVTSTSATIPITVTEPPQVSLHLPVNGTIYTAPAVVAIRGFASDADGITRIDLYQNDTFLASGTTVPFDYQWSNVPVGRYRLKAVATDAKGVSTTSMALEITVQADPLNAAEYRSQVVPTQMTAGRTYDVSVKMRNKGTTTWTAAGNYRLGSQSPQDNATWGRSRVDVSGSIARDAETTFHFTVTAPSTPGSYAFQWQMVQDGVEWFGIPTSIVQVTVVSAADGAIPVNYARGRLAGQTGPLSVDNGALARRALDGNTDGNYAAGSVAETPMANQPMWEVSLATPSVVNQIDLWNRTDCCSERLANFYVFIVPDYPLSDDPVALSTMPNVWSYYFSGPASAHITIPVPSVTARIVRVQLAGQGILSLAEVQVWNVQTAALGNATQSSTLPTTPSGDAFRAVDGNIDGAYPKQSVTHTAAEVQPWWQAELNTSSPVQEVRVWNRTDCCAERLTDFYLFVSDAPFSSPSLSSTLSQPGVSAYYHPGPTGASTTIRVNRTGRYFRVQLAGTAANHLSLAEVQVSVGPLTPPPAVSLTGPADGQIFPAPATIPLRASVTGGSGTATVHYYNGANLIGSSSTGPSYAFDWTNVPIGGYSVRATVVDANTESAESAPITVHVRPANAAAFVSQTVPSAMTAGKTYPVTVVMKNTGGATWTSASMYALGSQGPQDNANWGRTRVALPASIAPDSTATFQFTVTAPSTPGLYTFQWRMVQDTVEWFGETTSSLNVTVAAPVAVSMTQPTVGAIHGAPATVHLRSSVTGGSGTATVRYYNGTTLIGSSTAAPSYPFDWPNVPTGEYAVKATVADANGDSAESASVTFRVRPKNVATFVSQTVPGTMTAGQSYPVTVVMKNTGGAIWTSAAMYALGSQGPQDNGNWGRTRVALPASIAPDATATFQFNVTAPSTAGNYTFQWRMVQDGVEWFGDYSTATVVTVNPATNPVPSVASITPAARTAGTGAFKLTVNGSNFVSTSSVLFNGVSRQTTFTSSSQLTADMLASDVQTAGTFSITVLNPSPGGGASNVATLTVNPAPTITITSPASATTVTTPTDITINASTTGQISKVEFFRDTTPLGTVTTAPYSVVWTNAVPGIYGLTAKATTTDGTVASSAPVTITVRSSTAVNATGVYRASTDFSLKQGQSNWYYLDSTGVPMNVTASGLWQGAEYYNRLWQNAGHPGANIDAVRQWVAPIAGTIRVSGSASDANLTCGNGAVVYIKRGTQILWQQTLSNTSTVFPYDFTITISAGEPINFVINSLGGDLICDGTNFDPTITYVAPSATYRARTDYSATQGHANWHYLDATGPMTFSTTEGMWKGSTQWAGMWQGGVHPSATKDTILQWMAPVAGTVRVKGTVWDGNVTCGNGATFFIKRGSQILWQQALDNVTTAFPYDFNVAVAAGEPINFVISSRGDPFCDATNVDPTVTYLTMYRASTDFSGSQGRANWSYVGTSGTPMTYVSAENQWRGSEQWHLLWNDGGHPGATVAADAVRQWKAPFAGNVRITGNVSDRDGTCGNGVIASIRRGSEVLWQQTIDNGNATGFFYNLSLSVAQGELINFVLNSRGGDHGCDSTNFDPTVHIALPSHRASAEYSSTQGQANWYYLSSSGAPMTYSAADNMWKGTEAWHRLWSNAGHPGATLDAIRQWKAPSAGNIRIAGNVSDANTTCGNGVVVTIRRGTQILWQQTLENTATAIPFDLSLSITQGETIDFVINSRGDVGCDSTNFDPTIHYVVPLTSRASTDFSSVQGQAGWQYLDGRGIPMTFLTAENKWRGEENWVLLWSAGGHPGATTDAMRQWRAPLTGTVRIAGTVTDGDTACGNGVVVSIKRGAQLLWQQTIENGNTTGVAYDLSTPIAAGEHVSFIINSRGGDYSCDSTTFDPTVQYVPPW